MKILIAEDDADKIKMRELNYATALNCVAVIVTQDASGHTCSPCRQVASSRIVKGPMLLS